MTKAILTAAIAASAVLIAAPVAFAGSAISDDATTFRVSTAGVDLNAPAGARTMLHRIERASSLACGEQPFIADLQATWAWRVCVKGNVNRALDQLNAPQVTTIVRPAATATLAENSRR